MGSVGRDYRCPLCGRVGNGGYAVDGFDYPICTEGTHSCLWYQVMERNKTPEEIVGNALRAILCRKFEISVDDAARIAAYCRQL